ncbi:CvpA family protein [Acinetobacter sp. MD2(2019)]|uniref:CvpA family protein n=1 Tax=Acinetobacter sp. MD2(2019) TaxID=2605273 RepID=UPI002D1E878C|nr:CvpA family protein [Acinetobacter sp. MD2(2019)]MEB3752784.1 CvpA family protein [Acinetobacter sp. MD2(2019)]
MNVIDIVLFIVLIIGGLGGLRQGLIKSLANLIGWICALILGARYTNDLAPYMTGLSHDAVVQKIAAFAFIVLIIVVVTWLISAIFNKLLSSLKLGPLNRLAGGIFGSLKSLLIVLITMQGVQPWVQTAQSWKQSKMVQTLLPYAPLATELSKEIASDTIEHMNQGKSPSETSSVEEKPDQITSNKHESGHSAENPFN